jgi:hypothetical protein
MVEVAHAHEPQVVVDGLRTDRHGRPVSWWYHVECLACGVSLPQVGVEALWGRSR